MGLRINNNVEAFNAHRQLTATGDRMSRSMERLSSGLRVNRAADDAAGLAISEKLRAQSGGLAQAQRNAQDAVSLVQTAEGALAEVHAMLQRIRELAVQYKNDTLSTSDRVAITSEVAQLSAELGAIGANTEFNGISLLNTTASVTFQIGAEDGQTLGVARINLNSATGVDPTIFTQFAVGNVTLASIDAAINNVSSQRSTFGAVQNRLDHTMTNLAAYQENLLASESRIRDVDMASEMVDFTKYQILQQAGMSMLAQANASPQSVLTLLR